MLQHLIHFPLYYRSIGRLRKVKNKRKFQPLSSKSGRGRLREVVAYKRFQIVILLGDFSYFGKLVAEERWSQPEGRLYFDC